MYTRSQDCPVRDICVQGGKGTVQIKDLTDAAGLYHHGRMFAHVTIQPGCSIGYHQHIKETEFYYILKGEAVLTDNGTEVILRAGDISATPDQQFHGLENRSSEPVELIALIVTEA